MAARSTRSTATRPPREAPIPDAAVGDGGRVVTIDIYIEKLPEGVFLGTSPDIAGLTVETSTRDEMIEAAREVALQLRDLAGVGSDLDRLRLRFIEFG